MNSEAITLLLCIVSTVHVQFRITTASSGPNLHHDNSGSADLQSTLWDPSPDDYALVHDQEESSNWREIKTEWRRLLGLQHIPEGPFQPIPEYMRIRHRDIVDGLNGHEGQRAFVSNLSITGIFPKRVIASRHKKRLIFETEKETDLLSVDKMELIVPKGWWRRQEERREESSSSSEETTEFDDQESEKINICIGDTSSGCQRVAIDQGREFKEDINGTRLSYVFDITTHLKQLCSSDNDLDHSLLRTWSRHHHHKHSCRKVVVKIQNSRRHKHFMDVEMKDVEGKRGDQLADYLLVMYVNHKGERISDLQFSWSTNGKEQEQLTRRRRRSVPLTPQQPPITTTSAPPPEPRGCHRRSWYVDFAGIQWDSWIIEPPGYDAHYCTGECSNSLSASVVMTNHAYVKNVYLSRVTVASGQAPLPPVYCVPVKLSPISILYFTSSGGIAAKTMPEMIAEQCACI